MAQLREQPKIEPREQSMTSRARLDGLMAHDMFSETLAPSLISSSADESIHDDLIQSIVSFTRVAADPRRLQQKPTDDLLRMALVHASRHSLSLDAYDESLVCIEKLKVKIERLLDEVNRRKGSKLPTGLLSDLWKSVCVYGETMNLLYMHLSALLMWKTHVSDRTLNEQQDRIAQLETELKGNVEKDSFQSPKKKTK
jgi:hypothetical protein